MPIAKLGLEQCRIKLLALAALANAGNPSIISRNGKPYAALMSVQALEKATASPQALRDKWNGP